MTIEKAQDDFSVAVEKLESIIRCQSECTLDIAKMRVECKRAISDRELAAVLISTNNAEVALRRMADILKDSLDQAYEMVEAKKAA